MQSKSMQEYWQDSYLAADNDVYVETLYDNYLINPDSVDLSWRRYFDSLLQQYPRGAAEVSHLAIQ